MRVCVCVLSAHAFFLLFSVNLFVTVNVQVVPGSYARWEFSEHLNRDVRCFSRWRVGALMVQQVAVVFRSDTVSGFFEDQLVSQNVYWSNAHTHTQLNTADCSEWFCSTLCVRWSYSPANNEQTQSVLYMKRHFITFL